MKKTVLLYFALIVLCALSNVQWTSAQTPTSDVLRDSVKQKVAEELAQIKQAVSKKAFLGTVLTKTDATVALDTYTKQARNILLTTETTIKLASGKDGTPADVKSNDYILIMGDVDSAGTMTSKRLLVITPPAADTRKVTFTKYADVTAKPTSSTTYTKVDAGKIVKAKSTDFKATSQVIAVTKGTTILSLHLLP